MPSRPFDAMVYAVIDRNGGLMSNEARQSACMIGRFCLTTLTILAALAWIPASTAARTREGAERGCGVLVDSAHPWRSHVPGSTTETGDHWIAARNGPLSTCAFTELAIHRLLALPVRTYQGRDVARLLGGVCSWFHGIGQETIQPFAQIQCPLPTPRHRHIIATVHAIVDPDPAFIH
jgi:hypothetical protein